MQRSGLASAQVGKECHVIRRFGYFRHAGCGLETTAEQDFQPGVGLHMHTVMDASYRECEAL